MFSPHNSWVYFIVDGDTIVKVGETSQPLGIESEYHNQPITGTKSRLGRYRKGDQTDTYIRNELVESVKNNQVSIWARKCELKVINEIQDKITSEILKFHKMTRSEKAEQACS